MQARDEGISIRTRKQVPRLVGDNEEIIGAGRVVPEFVKTDGDVVGRPLGRERDVSYLTALSAESTES